MSGAASESDAMAELVPSLTVRKAQGNKLVETYGMIVPGALAKPPSLHVHGMSPGYCARARARDVKLSDALLPQYNSDSTRSVSRAALGALFEKPLVLFPDPRRVQV